MNYLKRIGRLVAICICAVCVGIIPITAHAMEVSDKQIQPRMDYISSYGTELTISDSGEASVTGFVRGKKGVTNAYVKVTLQKKVSGSWVYVQSWESNGLISKLNSYSLKEITDEKDKGWQYLIKIEKKGGEITLISFMDNKVKVNDIVYEVRDYNIDDFSYLFE